MNTHLLKHCLYLAALALPCGLVHGQAAINGAGGVNMLGVGKISNTPTITLPTSLAGVLSWEQGPALQGYVVPASQLTGLNTDGTLVSYEDILPLKAIKLQVVTGAAGAAPTGVGTLIDGLGVDTNSVITDAFQLTTGAALGKVLTSNALGEATWEDAPTGSQTLSLSGSNLSISGGNSVSLAGLNTDSQNLSLSGLNLGISGGTGVTLPAPTVSLSGTTLSVANGGSVNLSGINTDSQTLSISGTTLSISGGNSVALPANQNLSLSGMSLGISGGTGITLPTPTPSVSGGNFVITTGGVASSIPLSSFPNIYNANGTLTADRTVAQGLSSLTFTGSGGVAINSGNVGIGTSTPQAKLEVETTGSGGGPADDIFLSSYSTSAYPTLNILASRGTSAAPVNLVNNDELGGMLLRGRANGGTPILSGVTGLYRGNGTTLLSDLRFTTSTDVAMIIDQRGYVGIGTTAPGSKLNIVTNGSTGGVEDDISITSYGTPSIFNLYNASRGTEAAPANLQNGDTLVSWGTQGRVSGSWQGLSGFRSVYRGNGTTPLADFIISTSNNDRLYIQAGGNVGIGTNAPTSKLSVNGTADKVGGGAWGTFSDVRVKKDIKDYTKGLAEVMKIHTVTFKYNEKSGYSDTSKEFVGVIAQEIEKVLPSTVTKTDVDPAIKDKRTFDSSELTYTLINAVKEQQQQISKQDSTIKALEADKEKLATQIKELKAQAAEIAQIKSALETMHKLVTGKAVPAPAQLVRN